MSAHPKGKTRYNPDWGNPQLYPDIAEWIQPVSSGNPDDIYYFKCKVCKGGRLSLSNMGVSAPRKHMTDSKDKYSKRVECNHNKRMRLMKVTKKDCFFRECANVASPPLFQSNESQPLVESSSSTTSVLPSSASSSSLPTQPTRKVQAKLNNAPSEVLRSWIIWALHVVHSHQSLRSAGGKGELFQTMFPDSEIAEQFNLSAGKLSYMINHGLAPYFKNNIMNELLPKESRLPVKFTSCFDESFNKVTFSKQMDIHVLYYNETTNMVERVYLGSQFMGHATVDDTMADFKTAHKGLDIVNNLMQLSMDGPNINLRFLVELEDYRKSEDPNAPSLINIGSCGIHVLHGAYKTAHGVTDWEVEKTLRASHGIFKKSPARRADYLKDNGIEDRHDDQTMKSHFPLKFCGHRWLENGKALTRFLDIIDKLAVFMVKSKERKNFPAKDERFPLLLKNTKSNIFRAYCEFSASVCRDIEPFLKLFQAEKPLAIFLYCKLKELVFSLMERFVKPNVLQENMTVSKLMKLDLKSEDNLLSLQSINIGFGAKAVLRKLTTTEKPEECKFRKAVRAFLIRHIEKIFERSPLKYKLTRSLSSLSPVEVSLLKPDLLKQRFNCLVQLFYDDGWITSTAAERAEKQYSTLIKNDDFLKEAKKFNINDDRIDSFYARILDSSDSIDLQNVVRMVLIISHGNARVESGFSVNEDILLPNMLEETIISQRIVYEGVHKAGDATKVEITPELLKMAKNSYRTFTAANEEKKKSQSAGQKQLAEKRKAAIDLKHAVERKKAVVDQLQDKIRQHDMEISAFQELLQKK